MDTLPATSITWDPRLPLDIALNESSVTGRHLYTDEALIARYDLTQADYDLIRQLPAFRAQVREAIQELQANGLTVKRKSSALFEYYLDTSVPLMMQSDYTDAKTKLEIIKFLGQVAGKDGKADAEQVSSAPALPTLNIILQTAPGTPQIERVVSEQ